MMMTMKMKMRMLMWPVWVLWAVWYFSAERGPCMRKHLIELDCLYRCCVPLIVSGGVHRLLKHWK